MRILVADAHPPHAAANADAVEALLALSGADVRRVAAPAQPAATRTRKRRPRRRCIHPGGWAVAELVRSLGPSGPRIVFSTGAPQDIPEQIAEMGCVMEKPYDPKELVEVLTEPKRRGLISRLRAVLK